MRTNFLSFTYPNLFLALPTQIFTQSISIQAICSLIYLKALSFQHKNLTVVVLRRQGKE